MRVWHENRELHTGARSAEQVLCKILRLMRDVHRPELTISHPLIFNKMYLRHGANASIVLVY